MQLPLSDITVLDLSRILSGPFATTALSDFGARVIKVEPPQGDDTRTWGPPFVGPDAAYFLAVNRNKESVVLDLKAEADRRVLEELVRRSHVVVENFRPGTLERLGFGWRRLQEINPQIILCSISGFGQTGPKRDLPAFDQIAQGMGGLMSVTGEPGGAPTRAGFPVADLAASMWALYGIMLALRHRDRTGEGQWVDVSLLDAIISFQTYQAQNYFATGEDPEPQGRAHANIVPYQTFAARDGYFNVAVGNQTLWRAFCRQLGLDIADDPRFATNADRLAHRAELIALLESVFAGMTVEQVVGLMEAGGVPAGPLYQVSQVFSDPQVVAREMLIELPDPSRGPMRQIGVPVKMSRTKARPRSAPPLLGMHSDAIRREVGGDPDSRAPSRAEEEEAGGG